MEPDYKRKFLVINNSIEINTSLLSPHDIILSRFTLSGLEDVYSLFELNSTNPKMSGTIFEYSKFKKEGNTSFYIYHKTI